MASRVRASVRVATKGVARTDCTESGGSDDANVGFECAPVCFRSRLERCGARSAGCRVWHDSRALERPDVAGWHEGLGAARCTPDDFPILDDPGPREVASANLALASTPGWLRSSNGATGRTMSGCCVDSWQSQEAGTLYAVTRLVAVNADGSDMRVLLQHRKAAGRARSVPGSASPIGLVDDPRRVLVPEDVEQQRGVP